MARHESPDVVAKVVRRRRRVGAAPPARTRSPGRYLVRRGDVFFFQIRAPKDLVPCAKIPPLRVKIAATTRRRAQDQASWLARLARAAFEARLRADRTMHPLGEVELGFPSGESDEEFLANLLTFLRSATALIDGPPPPDDAKTLRAFAVWRQTIDLEREVRKGSAGNPLVRDHADVLREEIWRRRRAGEGIAELPPAERVEGAHSSFAGASSVASAPSDHPTAPIAPPIAVAAAAPLAMDVAPAATATSAPLFSVAASEYLDWRKGAGADAATISTARMRLDVFLALMGDKPIDAFVPRDLQLYVNTLQYLPVEFGRDGKDSAEIRLIGARAAAERNSVERCWEPLSRKTIEDGYVQIFKAVVNDAVRNCGLSHHPFAGARIAWPKFTKASVAREALDDETVNRVFSLGVASGYLDDALLPGLSLTSSRRIGLLAFIRGSDFERKNGVIICRVDGIVYDPSRKTWFRVPYKTLESLAYFVVHNIWSETGFVDWAMAQGDAFLFRQLHATRDPADALSKRMNRLLRRAGARGRNIEVAHSFRHGAKDLMTDDEIDDRAVRKQMGHAASGDAHAGYGSRTELRRAECLALASLPLPTSIDWSIFRGLDFEAMASKPRGRGKGVRSMLNESDDA